MTTLLERSATTGLSRSAPLPAAGRPASVPPPPVRSQSVSVRPPPPSLRPPPPSLRPPAPSFRPRPSSGLTAEDVAGRQDETRTSTTRGRLRKIVKGPNAKSLGPQAAPTSLSPDAVLKATLDSAFANRRDQLMPGPPSDLLEDRADFAPSSRSAPLRAHDRAVLSVPVDGPKSYRPPPSHAPPSNSSRPSDVAAQSAPLVPRSHSTSRGRRAGGSTSVPAVVMSASSSPAHFMKPQAPFSDPPGTAVTSGHRVGGRPARSWAVALLACGAFVAVAAAALMRAGESVVDTTASFVDPSRPTTKAASQAASPAPASPAPAPVEVTNVPASPDGPPPGLIGASPITNPPPPEPPVAVAPVVAATVATQSVAFAPVAVPPPAPKPAVPSRPVVAWKPPPPPPPKAAPKPAPPAPAAAAPAADEESSAKKGAAAANAKKSGKGGDTDDETKKALEALQKAQLESASSFGDK